jgi:iron complex transport system ATP-binding protein
MSVVARDVTVELGGRRVVDGVDLRVDTGQWLSIIGPNGAGKSTLMRALLGLVTHGGSISIDGEDGRDMSRRERARRLAYLPQSPATPEGMRVLDYVLLGVNPRLARGAWPGGAEAAEAEAALAQFGLADLAGRWVSSLSGGERQLALVARALVQRASTLILDEPTTALDLGHQLEVLEAVDDLRRHNGVTVIATMHDLGLAGEHADHMVLLAGGRVVAGGSPAEVLDPALISRHYGASVDVIVHDGRHLVVPLRRTEPR